MIVLSSAKDAYRVFAVVALLSISNYIVYQSASVSSPSELLRGSNATLHEHQFISPFAKIKFTEPSPHLWEGIPILQPNTDRKIVLVTGGAGKL